ncbi:MAG TPA: 2-dehydropantoate 2-reductase [Rhodocyclaceae bacterium]|nr:MAG: 2-dehydropantoate 2-reductase [Rhodocyclales bacterium CG_4_10_14_3_um_filter_68_10]PJA57700.1 MAG: 2-dehydropantoate 2-reductase [Rhodocyclales bacterium CG_4_9_14_3_um_filter_68_10]HCX33840.1 2-dehydropantoate 2-reductase [Rhodocyclaceae bacterium]
MKILVLGAGATGGYFGARLAAAGAEVTFLVRPERRRQLEQDGLSVRSPFGDLRIKPRTVVESELQPEYGAILLTCKAYDLDGAMASMAPAVGPRTAIIPLLNGLRHIAMLDERFGADRVLGGLCHIAATLTPRGEILHLNDIHLMTIGARLASQNQAIRMIDEAFRGAGFTLRISDAIERELWEKFCFLATLAAITCLMRGAIGDIVATRDGVKFMAETLDTCIAVARRRGAKIEEAWRERTLVTLIKPGSTMTASMLRDLESGSRIECEQVIGDMLRRSEVVGVDAPWLKAAYCHLQTYEIRHAREACPQ